MLIILTGLQYSWSICICWRRWNKYRKDLHSSVKADRGCGLHKRNFSWSFINLLLSVTELHFCPFNLSRPYNPPRPQLRWAGGRLLRSCTKVATARSSLRSMRTHVGQSPVLKGGLPWSQCVLILIFKLHISNAALSREFHLTCIVFTSFKWRPSA